MPTITARSLTDYLAEIFRATGSPEDEAQFVASSLVRGNLAGHESHGVIRVGQYVQGVREGVFKPTAKPSVVHQTKIIARVDGGRTYGQLSARFAANLGADMAAKTGLSAVALFNANHVGRMGEWVSAGLDRNLIGMAFCTATGHNGRVAPYGSRAPVLGTNPFACAVPVAGSPPILVDFATSIVAEGKLRVAINQGKEVPDGWILDGEGLPTNDPHEHYKGGALLTIGAYKGYGLSLLMDLLGGVLAGRGTPATPGLVSGNGVIFLFLDIEEFRGIDDFNDDASAFLEMVKKAPTAPGFDEILLPGEPEHRSTETRMRDGIPLDEATWSDLVGAGRDWGVEPPEVA